MSTDTSSNQCSTLIQVVTYCSRDDNFVADTGYNDGDKWIQLVTGLHVSGVDAALRCNVL